MKKPNKKLKARRTVRQDVVLAVLLGAAVTSVGVIVTRYSQASGQQTNSFNRDPVTQMRGGSIVKKRTGQQVRIASQSAPGVNPVFTIVSKEDMAKTRQVCVDYLIKQTGTFINVTYNSPTAGLATSSGRTKNSGSGTECVLTNGQAVAGTVNVNVTPGAAQITRMYGLPLATSTP